MLRAAELRVTRPRVAVLGAVHDNPHADTDAIIDAVRASSARCRTRRSTTCCGRSPRPGWSAGSSPRARWRATRRRVGDNHHHVVCRSCGAIADVDCAVGDAPCLTASDDHGFVIDEAEVIYWGICPDCATATASRYQPRRTR